MRQTIRRAAALFLALTLGLAPLAHASEALGHDLHKSTVELCTGTTLTRQRFWSDTYWDLRTEGYLHYVPNGDVLPAVVYGDSVCSQATLTAMARAMESQGKRVVAGTNGDFYVMATGAPVGVVMTEGVLRSIPGYRDSWYYAVGFRPDGTVMMGVPRLTVTATFNNSLTVSVAGGVNKVRNAKEGYFLFTEDFGANTKNISPGVDVILTPVTEGLGESLDIDLQVSALATPTPSPTPTPTVTPTAEPMAAPAAGPDAVPTAEPTVTPTAEPTVEPTAEPTAAPTDEPEEEIDESSDLKGNDLPDAPYVPTVVSEIDATVTKSDRLRVNSRVSCVVQEVVETGTATAIAPGSMILSVNKNDDPALIGFLLSLKAGDTVDIDVTCPDPVWTEAREMVGAMHQLVKDGQVQEGLANSQGPRTAIGVKADGSVIFYTIDGRQSKHSVGASLNQVAKRLVELGCVEALGLDGGGSTTLAANLPGGEGVQLVNRPSDGAQRANSVAVLLTTQLEPTGVPGHLYVTSEGENLLAGARTQLSALPLDTAYYPVESVETPIWSVTAGEGAVDEAGVFTAGGEKETVQVAAALGELTGSASISVIKTPDKVTLSDETAGVAVDSLNLAPNETVDLKASAVWRNLPLTAQDDCFTWTLEGDVGTVDENGVLTAAAESGSGTLTVSAGGTTRRIGVTVAGHVLLMDGFEDGVAAFTATGSAAAYAEEDGQRVRFGRASARVEYDTGETGLAVLTADLPVVEGERYLNFWICGDGSGNVLNAIVGVSGGSEKVELTTLDFTGWQQVTVALPAGTNLIRLLFLTCAGETAGGTIWLDQLTTANELLVDNTPPDIDLSAVEGRIVAVITDNADQELDVSRLSLTYDGKPMEFTWDGAAGTLTAPLPESDGKLHRLTVTAADVSGNLGRASLDRPASAVQEEIFLDMTEHWAADQVRYLYDQGIVSGIPAETGLVYAPDGRLSRGDFLLMTAKWLGLDLDAYADVELPFADVDAIPGWDLPGVKAMYALGYLKGSQSEAGLMARANDAISRAEVMTVLGRIQPKGYPEAELEFIDAADTPDWAAPYIQALAAQGVVSGSGGTLRPNDAITRAEAAKLLYMMR